LHPAVLVVMLPVGMVHKQWQARDGLYADFRRLLMDGPVHLQFCHRPPGCYHAQVLLAWHPEGHLCG